MGIGSDTGTSKTKADYVNISYFSSDERFVFDDFTGAITRYIGTETNIEIPDKINDTDVKKSATALSAAVLFFIAYGYRTRLKR